MKKVLFLGCNYKQLPYLKKLKELGYYVVGTDSYHRAVGAEYCDMFYCANYNFHGDLINIGEIEEFTSSDYVFTASSQFAHLGASIFAKHFGIDYPSTDTIETCLDKSKFYKVFEENGISIPDTKYVHNEEELLRELSNYDSEDSFYLKSDMGKSPNYIYNFKNKDVPLDSIVWKKDQYFNDVYCLQRTFLGEHLRVNIYPNGYDLFPFYISKRLDITTEEFEATGIIEKLRDLINNLGLNKFLVKFDIIINKSGYVVLDIGLDPPYRRVKCCKENNIDFATHYINQYILNKITYPSMTRYPND